MPCEVQPLSHGLLGELLPHVFSLISWVTSGEYEANIPILLMGGPKVPEGEDLLLEEVGWISKKYPWREILLLEESGWGLRHLFPMHTSPLVLTIMLWTGSKVSPVYITIQVEGSLQ